MSLLMPRMQYGGKASASVAVTGAAGLLPTEAEDQEKLVVTCSSTAHLPRWFAGALLTMRRVSTGVSSVAADTSRPRGTR